MFWVIIGLLYCWIQPLSAEVLEDTPFNLGEQLAEQLENYPSLILNDLEVEDVQNESYFPFFYGPNAVHTGQQGEIGTRVLDYARILAHPVKAGLKIETEAGGGSYASYSDGSKVQLADRQVKEMSHIASFTTALGEVLSGLATQGERRQQLAEHMITWKRDVQGRIIRSPVENLREDVQNLNYMLSRGMMVSLDALILAETAQLASQSIYALISQGNSSFIPIRKLQEDW